MLLQQIHLEHHLGEPLTVNKLLKPLNTGLIRRHLRLEIREQFPGIARGNGHGITGGLPVRVLNPSIANEQQIAQKQPLILDAAAEGGHRPRGGTTDIGMVATAGDKKAGR